jgi:hypothetical protein
MEFTTDEKVAEKTEVEAAAAAGVRGKTYPKR